MLAMIFEERMTDEQFSHRHAKCGDDGNRNSKDGPNHICRAVLSVFAVTTAVSSRAELAGIGARCVRSSGRGSAFCGMILTRDTTPSRRRFAFSHCKNLATRLPSP